MEREREREREMVEKKKTIQSNKELIKKKIIKHQLVTVDWKTKTL